MAKFFGKVGFAQFVEKTPGNYEEGIIEKSYYGDVLRYSRRWDSAPNQQNDNINVSNHISILADGFAYNHLSEIRYVVWLGTKWKASSVDVEYPRLNIMIGGVYNGDED